MSGCVQQGEALRQDRWRLTTKSVCRDSAKAEDDEMNQAKVWPRAQSLLCPITPVPNHSCAQFPLCPHPPCLASTVPHEPAAGTLVHAVNVQEEHSHHLQGQVCVHGHVGKQAYRDACMHATGHACGYECACIPSNTMRRRSVVYENVWPTTWEEAQALPNAGRVQGAGSCAM